MSKKDKPVEEKPIFVEDLSSLQDYIMTYKPNPLEKMMAVNLLLEGYNFYPQYRIDAPEGWTINGRKYFLADFYIPALNAVIETDGKIHEEMKAKDKGKDNTLTCLGYYVFRFNWDEVMDNSEDFNIVNFLDHLLVSRGNEEALPLQSKGSNGDRPTETTDGDNA